VKVREGDGDAVRWPVLVGRQIALFDVHVESLRPLSRILTGRYKLLLKGGSAAYCFDISL
jgi:hypothetical protein